VILDGLAVGHGDPARGSRYNNPIRYLNNDPPPAVVIVYSADGGIDLLPDLAPRQDPARITTAVSRYVQLVDTRPIPLKQIFETWDELLSLAFYLSAQQCREVNAASGRLKSWSAEHDRSVVGMSCLDPNPAMNDTYWLPAPPAP
jgi:hypothetical protein